MKEWIHHKSLKRTLKKEYMDIEGKQYYMDASFIFVEREMLRETVVSSLNQKIMYTDQI